MRDDVAIAVLQRQLDGLAEEMGEVLVRSAMSPNITERRDCSTALFGERGQVLAQAAHIPVHLGSMQHAVDAAIAAGMAQDEVWILNDPYGGGTHLPDITAVTSIYDRDGALLGYAAARAHHADVGGRTPGSMTAQSARIEDEGVRITPTLIGLATAIDVEALGVIVSGMRQPRERRGDLAAQCAALDRAVARLPGVVDRWGGPTAFRDRCGLLDCHAERVMRAALRRCPDGSGFAERELELPANSAAAIRCAVAVDGDALSVDLERSDPQVSCSFNCPLPVTWAAVLFAARSAFAPDVPSSSGWQRAIDVRTRPGTVVDARYPGAVAAGNVEVSSVIVDTVLDALATFLPDIPANGAGTMSNLVVGSERFSMYETIGGGQGATSGADGPSAVHVAMTNTRNTPIEALEHAYPLRVETYAIRDGSGGAGAHRGGDGIVREVRVLEACELSLLSQRHRTGPSGRQGGGPGAAGRAAVDGVKVDGVVTCPLDSGSVVRVETPGGGGYGSPER